ncbi:hypothetical protein Trydic_g10456 [Trypoxylus dichotomus]
MSSPSKHQHEDERKASHKRHERKPSMDLSIPSQAREMGLVQASSNILPVIEEQGTEDSKSSDGRNTYTSSKIREDEISHIFCDLPTNSAVVEPLPWTIAFVNLEAMVVLKHISLVVADILILSFQTSAAIFSIVQRLYFMMAHLPSESSQISRINVFYCPMTATDSCAIGKKKH